MMSLVAVGLLLVLACLWGWIAGYQRGWDDGWSAAEAAGKRDLLHLQTEAADREGWWQRGEPPPWESG